MPDSRRKFDPQFREGAVRIVRETGKPIAQIARDLGVHPGTLGNWVAKDRAEHEGTQGLSTGDVAELKRLRAQNAQLRMERDVLKRSVVLWVLSRYRDKTSTRRRSERGPLRRRPEDHAPGAAHRDLRGPGRQHLLVLQVDRSRAHRAAASPRRPGREGARAVRGVP